MRIAAGRFGERSNVDLTFLPLPGRKFRFDLREVPD